jgi:hypothetical protein
MFFAWAWPWTVNLLPLLPTLWGLQACVTTSSGFLNKRVSLTFLPGLTLNHNLPISASHVAGP